MYTTPCVQGPHLINYPTVDTTTAGLTVLLSDPIRYGKYSTVAFIRPVLAITAADNVSIRTKIREGNFLVSMDLPVYKKDGTTLAVGTDFAAGVPRTAYFDLDLLRYVLMA